ncbi:MAG TPA: trypsin-like peptidase domain-containing protein [Pseudonocardiaceae bacterium]|jgi:putative serine protease PepD|nr:trypsin-like peptidase domain-containing protein [Pseudonocardiaceae bacterium]
MTQTPQDEPQVPGSDQPTGPIPLPTGGFDPRTSAAPPQFAMAGQLSGGTPNPAASNPVASNLGRPMPPMGPSGPVAQSGSLPKRPRTRLGMAGLVAGAVVLAAVLGGGAGALVEHSANGSSASSAVATATAASTNTGSATGESVSQIAASVLPSVVEITQEGSDEEGIGSGIILSSTGEILTNNHVIADGGTLTVTFANGRTAKATVVGTSPSSDLAVIKAQGVSGLTPADLGDSGTVAVGQQVVAIGSPEGLQNTVTSGIVSALNRKVTVAGEQNQQPGSLSGFTGQSSSQVTYSAIQTDAAINPGNSGGPLVNSSGQVIGINSAIYSPSSSAQSQGGSVGIGFAIPINQAKTIIQQLESGSVN